MSLGSPDFFEQHLPCQQLTTVRDQDFEHVVLGWCQADLLPIDEHAPRGEIDEQGPLLEARLRAGLRPSDVTQGNADTRQHLVHTKGFLDVVICP